MSRWVPKVGYHGNVSERQDSPSKRDLESGKMRLLKRLGLLRAPIACSQTGASCSLVSRFMIPQRAAVSNFGGRYEPTLARG